MEDNELIALLDRKFAASEARMDARFGQMDVKFDNLRIEVGVRLDDMHTDIKKIAEGVQNVDEKIERFRDETMDHLIDIRSDLKVSFKLLNKRVTDLENRHS